MSHHSLQLPICEEQWNFALPFENGPLYNLVHVDIVVIIQRNHSNGLKIIPISFSVRKFIIAERNVEIPTGLTT